MKEKEKKLADIIIRIPKCHSGRRMAYEPLGVIQTSSEQSEMELSPLNKSRHKKSHKPISVTELTPISRLERSSLSVASPASSTHSDFWSVNESHKNEDKRFRIFVIEKFNILISTLNQVLRNQDVIMSRLNEVDTQQSANHTAYRRNNLPISTKEELKELVEELETDRSKYDSLVSMFCCNKHYFSKCLSLKLHRYSPF